jgi:hypothetical protein
MIRYRGTQTSLTITLLGSIYIAIIMVRYRGPQTALIIAFPGCMYFAII